MHTPLLIYTEKTSYLDVYKRQGKGSLFILCADPDKDIEKRPAMRQLLHSVKNYVASKAFTPAKMCIRDRHIMSGIMHCTKLISLWFVTGIIIADVI